MKKIFLLISCALPGLMANAQHTAPTYPTPIHSFNNNTYSTNRTTGVGDTIKLKHIAATDTLTLYDYSSGGYVTGTNNYNDMGFAERYDFNSADSSIVVIGVMAQFGGKITPASPKSINFKLWNVSGPVNVSQTLIYSGFPVNSFDTITVPVTKLGIGPTVDTMKTFLFPAPTGKLLYSFYVGYDMSYDFTTLNGDTIGLATSMKGHRTSPMNRIDTVRSEFGDTFAVNTINVVNATQWSDNIWHENYTQNDSIFNNLAIYPIVIINNPTGIKSITRNNLSLYGCYPNPTSDLANIHFSLVSTTDVTITLSDMNGKIISTLHDNNVAPGDHTTPITTAQLAAGNYIYFIHTSDGAGIASQLTVTR